MPSARSSMLDRAPPETPSDVDTKPRPVEFRGAGFTPSTGRCVGLDRARAGRSRCGNSRAAPDGSIRCSCRRHRRLRSRPTSSRCRARSGSTLGWSVMRHRRRLAARHGGRRHRRFRDRPVDAGARRRHHLYLGAVSDSEDRAAAAVDPLARDREEPKIATIALGVFFSTAISVYSGVDAVPRNLIRMAQSFNVPFHAIVRRVIWPGALPSILAGFRITASIALLLVVSAEMIGAQYGIGAFVLQAGNLMQTDQLLAGVVILSLFGLAVGKLINLARGEVAALALSAAELAVVRARRAATILRRLDGLFRCNVACVRTQRPVVVGPARASRGRRLG